MTSGVLKDGTDDVMANGGPTERRTGRKGEQGSFYRRLVTQIVKYSLGPAL